MNFYGYLVNQNSVIGEVVTHFDQYAEVRKRFDVSKIAKYTANAKAKNAASDSLDIFKFPDFEPIMRGVTKI